MAPSPQRARFSLLLVVLLGLGCGDDRAQSAAPLPDTEAALTDTGDAHLDAAIVCEDAALAVDAPLDTQTDTQVAPDATPESIPRASWARLYLQGGESLRGELVATFNHNYWWNNRNPQVTFAVYDPDKYAPFPEDASLTFVSSRDVTLVQQVFAEPGVPTYRNKMRSLGLVLERVPFDEVAHVITAHDSYHLEENGFGDYAWDLVVTDDDGARYDGDGTENADYRVWDQPVYLPITGYVVEVARGWPDNDPGFYKPGSVSNYVGVQVGGSYYVYFLHFRQDSIPDEVQVGEVLPVGTLLGHVGNSGVTLEPHLHMTAFWYDDFVDPARYWSVPIEFASIFVSPTPIGPAIFQEYASPPARSWIASGRFKSP